MSGFKLLLTPLESLFVFVCLLMLVGEILSQQNGVKVVVEEDSDAVLPCLINTKEDITLKLFDWKKDGQKEVFMYDAGNHYNNGHGSPDLQFKGRVSHFQDQLMNGNASIKIQNTKMADSGNYICIFPRLQPRQTFNIELVVERLLRDRSGEIPAASPEPYITILDQTKDWSLLQCKVRGASPKPKVEWQDSSGNILPVEEPQVSEKGGRYYVTHNTTVTKTGRYRCVVTQEEISHQINAETFVFICEKVCEDCSTKEAFGWLAVAFVLGAAVPAVVLAAVPFGLRATKRITVCFNRGAAPEPTSTSDDLTKDSPLLQDEVTGEHQNENSSCKVPAEIEIV
ncbi:putative selection and upkeep of intraepithelial T-cells protein 1 homolog isoform X1 [Sparus aurata]|uniref:putative selection and upkeep of intraepithelial T-cells protein 1 homolog isoform X1 n=1 Tax=Sparus aurata TaxID=8175 RepID=UPI0011C10CCA|nr:putative selection and upkeep of intraepithelial T-cells protein 1 homolog isoform X1 [Sparus aurata]